MFLALGYLYSSVSLNNLNAGNARAVLAAGCLLGGMDELCGYAYQACRDSIMVNTINEWIDFVDTLPVPSDGTATPSELPRATVFGPYALELRKDVFHFLVATLPTILEDHSSPDVSIQSHGPGAPSAPTDNGREMTLLQIFSRLPFDLFKSAVESQTFQIGDCVLSYIDCRGKLTHQRKGSDQERFKFAKKAIDMRKRTRGSGVEETVVLAFGGGNSGSAVHVTRKMRKRSLFKVAS